MKILLTGASGRLGRELLKCWKNDLFVVLSHTDMDITKPMQKYDVDMVIHAAAYTDVKKAETDKEQCSAVNVWGTQNLLAYYSDIPFVFISSEYAYKPKNHYSVTKAIAEWNVMYYASQYLIIRTLFKPRPYPYDRAPIDQWTQGDYVDVIAPLIEKSIKEWLETKKSGITYVGTGKKTMYALARQSNPKVKKCKLRTIEKDTGVSFPHTYL